MRLTFTAVTARERIVDEVISWPGVTSGHGERGEFAFKVGGREIGHLHGGRVAHFSFPKDVGVQLREQGRVGDHPVFRDRVGLAERTIASDDDVRDVVALMRLNYDRIVERHGVPT